MISHTLDPCQPATIGSTFYSKTINLKNGNKIELHIWDTAGQELFRDLNINFIRCSECIVLGYAINSNHSFKSIKDYWYPTLKKNSRSDLIYLIENKIDLENEREVNKEEAIAYAKNNNLRFFKISCKNFTGINEFLNDLTEELIKR